MLEIVLQGLIALAAVAAAIGAYINSKEISQIHIAINSRMDELLILTRESSTAEGNIAGRAEKTAEIVQAAKDDLK